MTDRTDNVIPLHPATAPGDMGFMQCACKPEGVDFLVVAIHQDAGAIVAALVCPECERELPVVNGVVGQDPEGVPG